MLDTIFNQGAYNQMQLGMQDAVNRQTKLQAMAATAQQMEKQKADMEYEAKQRPLTLEGLALQNKNAQLKYDIDAATKQDSIEAQTLARKATAEQTKATTTKNIQQSIRTAAGIASGLGDAGDLQRQQTLFQHFSNAGMPEEMARKLSTASPELLEQMSKKFAEVSEASYLQAQRDLEAARRAQAAAEAKAAEHAAQIRYMEGRDVGRNETARYVADRSYDGRVDSARISASGRGNKGPFSDIKGQQGLDTLAIFRSWNPNMTDEELDNYRKYNPKGQKQWLDARDAEITNRNGNRTKDPVDLSGFVNPDLADRIRRLTPQPPQRNPSNLGGTAPQAKEPPKAATSYSMEELKKRYPKATEEEIRKAAEAKGIVIK